MQTIMPRLIIAALLLIPAAMAHAEFYKYTDKDGNVHYVDDMSRVPDAYHHQIETYKEKYDHLPKEKRQEMRERDAAIAREKEQQRQQQFLQNLNELEQQRREHFANKEKQQRETPVTVRANQVLVPVKLGYGNREVSTTLILDTGASIVALHRGIADNLQIHHFRKARAQVAGGQIIDTDLAKLSYIQVGPNRVEGIYAGILDFEGGAVDHSGLLGMNFLRHFDYSLDLKNSVIRWK